MSEYKNKRVLVFGGLGFMGVNLCQRLFFDGAKLCIFDLNITDQVQKNLKDLNIKSVRGDITVLGDYLKVVSEAEIIFNLAGRSGATASMENPFLDLKVNGFGVLNILETARLHNPKVKIVFPGSRLQFGKVEKVPVAEDHPMRPTSLYGIHKLLGENYHLSYHHFYGLNTCVLRFSNPYGPHLRMKKPEYNIFNYFIELALQKGVLKIYGEGSQIRDYIFIGDVVDALLAVGISKAANGEVFNVGSGVGTAFIEAAKTIVKVVGKGRIKQISWPEQAQNLETGDYIADITKIKKVLGWEPKYSLTSRIEKTVLWFKQKKDDFYASLEEQS